MTGEPKSPERLAVAFWLGIGSAEDVRAWAQARIEDGGDLPPEIYDALGATESNAEPLVWAFLRGRGFVLESREGKRAAVEVLRDQCRLFLAGQLAAGDLCEVVRFLESNLRELPHVTESEALGAGWLFDLWNACDWIEETGRTPELTRAATEFLNDRLLGE
jgi:hypothetical protein